MKTKFCITTRLLSLYSFLFFYSSFILGQDTVNITVYFDTDQYHLSTIESAKIAAFMDSIPPYQRIKIELFGHTDSRKDDAYNQVLAQNRAQTVKTILIDLGIAKEKIYALALGEQQPIASNETHLGRQKNRRVEIVVHKEKEKQKIIPLIPPVQDTIIKREPLPPGYIKENLICSKDTILTMPNGTLVSMGICDYLDYQDCFSIIEFVEPAVARAAGLSTMAADGSPLISVGMFEVKLNSNATPNCQKKFPCIKVYLPVRTQEACATSNRGFTRWFQRPDGTWVDSGDLMEMVEINGRLYYQTDACSLGKFNGDRRSDGYLKNKAYPVRVKVAKGLQLLEAKLSFDAPFTILEPTKKVSNRMMKFSLANELLCQDCSPAMIYAKALDKTGDTLVFNYTIAAPYHRRTAFGKCKGNVVKKFLFFFKIREKNIYRKYYLRRDDFEVLN